MRPGYLSIARVIVAASLVVGDVAVTAAQSHESTPEKPAQSAPAAKPAPPPTAAETPKPSTPPPDMKTVVERIQKRIEEEVTKPEAARQTTAKKRAAPHRAATSPPPEPDQRVHLTWRASLVWPAGLTDRPSQEQP
jgi:hypothetical protein